MMAAYAEDAVDFALSEYGVELDYSPASVEHVENMLAKLHDSMVPSGVWARLFKLPPLPEQVDQVSKMFGGYIGEVFKYNYGGEWSMDDKTVPGETDYSFNVQGHTIWPHFKCGKRLVDGPEENVRTYFSVLTKDMTPLAPSERPKLPRRPAGAEAPEEPESDGEAETSGTGDASE